MKMQTLYGFLAAAAMVLAATATAETWHLSTQTDGWQNVAQMPEGKYLMAISDIKQQLAAGSSADAVAALETLKKEFPDLAGGDLDAFIEAEKVYAKRNLGKAGKFYKVFLDTWPDSPLQPVVLERYFSIGAAFLQGQKRVFLKILPLPAFDDGVEIMHNIADKAGNAPISLRALQVLAENQERKKKYVDAYYTWAEINIRWPTGAEGRDSLLRKGRSLHVSYGGAQYDATVLQGARTSFEDFTQRYPQLAQQLDMAETLTLITEQLAYKQYEVGFYYERSGNITEAHKRYKEVMSEWPGTSAAQMAAIRLEPDASSAIRPTLRRKCFNGVSNFLDNWFGAKWLFGSSKKTPTDQVESDLL